jgi:hypothetical protein
MAGYGIIGAATSGMPIDVKRVHPAPSRKRSGTETMAIMELKH